MIVKSALIWAGLFAVGFTSISFAADGSHSGYVLNSSGGIIILNGLCIHTGEWTSEKAITECDPEVAAENNLKQPSQSSLPNNPTSTLPKKPFYDQ